MQSPSRASGSTTPPQTHDNNVCLPDLSDGSIMLKSILTDNTDIEEPHCKSWWKNLKDTSRDMEFLEGNEVPDGDNKNLPDNMDVLEDNKDANASKVVEDLFDIEVISSQKNYTLDLPDTSDNESVRSIVLPQKRLFSQKDNQPQNKFKQILGNRESLAKMNVTQHNITVKADTKNFLQGIKKSRPVFPAALLNITANKTVVNVTNENVAIEHNVPVRNIFGKRPDKRKKNIFADFIAYESLDEIPDIQPKVFAFQKEAEGQCINPISRNTEHSITSSLSNDMELDDWKHLPSSTMVENQLDLMMSEHTPMKRARLSKLSRSTEINTSIDKEAILNKTMSSKNRIGDTPTKKITGEVNNKIINETKQLNKRVSCDENVIKDQVYNSTRITANQTEPSNIVTITKELCKRSSKDMTREEDHTIIDQVNDNETEEEPDVGERPADDGGLQKNQIVELSKVPQIVGTNTLTVTDTVVYKTSSSPSNDAIKEASDRTVNEMKQLNKGLRDEKITDDHNHKAADININITEPTNIPTDKDMKELSETKNMVTSSHDKDLTKAKDHTVIGQASDIEFEDQNVSDIVTDDRELKQKSHITELSKLSQNIETNTPIVDDMVISEVVNKTMSSENIISKSSMTDNIKEESSKAIIETKQVKIIEDDSNDTSAAANKAEPTEKLTDVDIKELSKIKQKVSNSQDTHMNRVDHTIIGQANHNESQQEQTVDKSIENKREFQPKDKANGVVNDTDYVNRDKHNERSNQDDRDAINKSQESDSVHVSEVKQNEDESSEDDREITLEYQVSESDDKSSGSEGTNNDDKTENQSIEENHKDEIKDQIKIIQKSNGNECEEQNIECTEKDHEENLVTQNEEVEQDIDSEEEKQDIESEEEEQDIESEEKEQDIESEEEEQDIESEEEAQDIESEEEEQDIESVEKDRDLTQDNQVSENEEEPNLESLEELANTNQATENDDDSNDSEGIDSDNESGNQSEEEQNVDESAENEQEDQVSENEEQNVDSIDEDHELPSKNQSTENDNDGCDSEGINDDNENGDENMDDSFENNRAPVTDEVPELDNEEMDCDDDEAEKSAKYKDNSQNSLRHNATGNKREKMNSPEAILHDKINRQDTFTVKGRNTSFRKSKSMGKDFNIKPSLAPPRDSLTIADGTRDSSAEGSGWDSHRTTRKTLRQTFGKDFTPRKSLRALVMQKSAKLAEHADTLHSVTAKFPQANSTEYPEDSRSEDNMTVESDHEVSRNTRLATLVDHFQKIGEQNLEKKRKMEQSIRSYFKSPPAQDSLNLFRVPSRPPPRKIKPTSSKPKKQIKSTISFELPAEVIEDMKYKPPKRFQPSDASWITKRLYKYLENKLEPKYDYKARVRAEKLVESLYHFCKDIRRQRVASTDAVEVLKHEFARLDVVKTHFEFYNFFHDFMPREVRVKVVPDIVNNISLPRQGVFSDILKGNMQE